MFNYFLRRLLLLPLTLFFIVLVNFMIINLAPGDPTSFTEVSPQGLAMQKEGRSIAFSSDERYLQFREFYGLTLPILLNTWPYLSLDDVEGELRQLLRKSEMSTKDYDSLRIQVGDQSRFIMPHLLTIMENQNNSIEMRQLASHFFVRGGSRPAFIGSNLTPEQREWNNHITRDDMALRAQMWTRSDSPDDIQKKISLLRDWYEKNAAYYHFNPSAKERISLLFFETRFNRYMSRVLRLDFGTLRNDPGKTVISEVTRRFKYSLTLSLVPLLITFFACQTIGILMAFYQYHWQDYFFNLIFLVLYAIPIFVMAPFLIAKVALNNTFPFTDIPIPIHGFTSPDRIYMKMTSLQRLFDIFQHIALPLVAIIYGSLAAQARLSRTAVLEVMRQDYVRTAKAKGVPPFWILVKHVGRNASVTIVTSIAGSLGIVLGGSLIVETLFDINGFGKFFYDAIINRDYNVIMFSSLAGSFLTLMGYLAGDLAYMWLDPRISLE